MSSKIGGSSRSDPVPSTESWCRQGLGSSCRLDVDVVSRQISVSSGGRIDEHGSHIKPDALGEMAVAALVARLVCVTVPVVEVLHAVVRSDRLAVVEPVD